MFRLNHRSIKVTLFSEIHIKIISKISLTYHQIAFYYMERIARCIALLLYSSKRITLPSHYSILFHSTPLQAPLPGSPAPSHPHTSRTTHHSVPQPSHGSPAPYRSHAEGFFHPRPKQR